MSTGILLAACIGISCASSSALATQIVLKAVDASGSPVKEFAYRWRVELLNGEGRVERDWQQVTSRGGQVVFEGPERGWLEVVVKAEGYAQEYGTEFVASRVLGEQRGDRILTVQLAPALRIEGVVRDRVDGKPLAGAGITPLVPHPFFFSGKLYDSEHRVESDAAGRFELRDVPPDREYVIVRRGYDRDQRIAWQAPRPSGSVAMDVRLNPNPKQWIRGRVVTEAGQPLEGVQVRADKDCILRSDRDGRFDVPFEPGEFEPGKNALVFRKEGFVPRTKEFEPADRLKVTLKPTCRVRGRVTAADGKPVSRFTMMTRLWAVLPPEPPKVGAYEGVEIWHWQGTVDLKPWRTDRFDSSDGSFALTLGEDEDWNSVYSMETPLVWVSVWSEEHGAWEGLIKAQGNVLNADVRLARGVTVAGSLVTSRCRWADVRVSLTPADVRRARSAPPERFAPRLSGVSEEGRYRFDHMQPGVYRLAIDGKSITHQERMVVVPCDGLSIRPLTVRSTGRVFGSIYCPRRFPKDPPTGDPRPWVLGLLHPWNAAAQWPWWQHAGLEFTADGCGRFVVDDAPAGPAAVGCFIQYTKGPRVYSRWTNVLEGQTTELRFGDPSHLWDLPLEWRIGDGSQKQSFNAVGAAEGDSTAGLLMASSEFYLYLLPMGVPSRQWSPEPSESFVHARVANGRAVIPDVAPGKYRLRLYAADWSLLWTSNDHEPYWLRQWDFWKVTLQAKEATTRQGDPVAESDIEVTSRRDLVRLTTGAGCAVAQIRQHDDPGNRQIYESGRNGTCYSVGPAGAARVRHTTCDLSQEFRVSFLHPGKYTFTVRDEQGGRFTRLDDIPVRDDAVASLDFPRMQPGGTIAGRVELGPGDWPFPSALTATDSLGTTLRAYGFRGHQGEEFSFPGLWPGDWTIAMVSGDEVLLSAKATIHATETVRCDLVGK